ncbi:helix-turn-helix domain-containing protein [Streptomyces sp. NPDC048057]|uniref:nSTAND1 domain-containing NTPase n=1 Tax=Streptomyces sp. NPDC048057 TaxID=3155628 RepID=UPI0033DEE964
MDPQAGPVQGFACELRKLRATSGMTYRALAARAGYGVTTLSQAAAGEQLPTLPVVLAYVVACGGDPGEWEARWRNVVSDVADLDAGGDVDGAEAPYRGLARFETGDGARFFGRERLTAELLELMHRRRFAAVFGPSGSGKSSLLRAGLIPALRHPGAGTPRPTAIRILTPGPRPAHTHARLFDCGGHSPRGDRGDVDRADVEAPETVVIVDQFEEVFTLCHDPAERVRFLDLLLAARRRTSGLRVLLAVRADFYGRIAEHRDLTDALRDAQLLVGPMNPAELREVIVRPAAAQGMTVERVLTSRLVEEVADAPGGLPLLSHVLMETWRRRRGKTMTLAGYEAAGGVGGAVAKTAESVYRRFTDAEAAEARRVLLRMVAPGEGTPDTRRPADRRELQAHGRRTTETEKVLEAFVRARLLTRDGDTVDLAHEALLTAWPRLLGWIEQDRERLRVHQALTEAAHAWEKLGRDTGALYRGTRLATAEESFPPEQQAHLTALEHAFLAASLQLRRRERRAAARTTRRLRLLTVTLLVLVVVASALAWRERRSVQEVSRARDSFDQSLLAQELASESNHLIGANSDLATSLADWQHPGHEGSASFSPDGGLLATAHRKERTVQLWDPRTGRARTTLDGHARGVTSITFSPEGDLLATASRADGTVRLWGPDTGRLHAALGGHTHGVTSVTFSPRGDLVATASNEEPVVRIWEVLTGRLHTTLGAQPDTVLSVAFSTDSSVLAVAGARGGVNLWDLADRRVRTSLVNHTTPAFAMKFNDDGQGLLAVATTDQAIALWDAETGRPAGIVFLGLLRVPPATNTALP